MSIGVLLSDDLIFTSRIVGTGRAVGSTVRAATTMKELHALVAEHRPMGIIVDLHHPELDVPALLAVLRETCDPMPRVVGYGSHVDAARLKEAREAGCDLVLPRSAFVEQLETDLSSWLKSV